MTDQPPTNEVDFHFDVLCPYAYQTSKWIRSVRDELGVTINWRFFSLEEINRVEGKKHPWEREWSFGWSLMRIAALLRRTSMYDVDRWYAIAGKALHEDGNRPHEPAVARHLLEQLGLDPGLVDVAIADPSTHDEVKQDHDRVVAAGGYGVPTLFFGDHCLFGPVLIDPPVGEAAVRLWHAVIAWTEFPGLFELQQPKTKAIEQRIAATFRPYLEARDWVSINRGVEVGFTEQGFEVVGSADRDRSADRSVDGPGGDRSADGRAGEDRSIDGPGGDRSADEPGGDRSADGPGGDRSADEGVRT